MGFGVVFGPYLLTEPDKSCDKPPAKSYAAYLRELNSEGNQGESVKEEENQSND